MSQSLNSLFSPTLKPSGAGQSSRAGGPAGAADVQREGEPDAELQTDWVPGCCVSAQTAGGESCGLWEREEQEGEQHKTLNYHHCENTLRSDVYEPRVWPPPPQIDDLSREVGKLKDALNSLSQLSYSSGSPSKRIQQNQQLENMQQQIKQLQYQLSVRTPPTPFSDSESDFSSTSFCTGKQFISPLCFLCRSQRSSTTRSCPSTGCTSFMLSR